MYIVCTYVIINKVVHALVRGRVCILYVHM